MLRPDVLVGQRDRNAQCAQVAAGNLTTPPGSKGIVSAPGQRRSYRSQSRWKALLGKYGPGRTGHAFQKMARAAVRCWTSVLATYARSMCNACRVLFCAARSIAIASVTLALGTLAGV